jgi:hypothetical protein
MEIWKNSAFKWKKWLAYGILWHFELLSWMIWQEFRSSRHKACMGLKLEAGLDMTSWGWSLWSGPGPSG